MAKRLHTERKREQTSESKKETREKGFAENLRNQVLAMTLEFSTKTEKTEIFFQKKSLTDNRKNA